VYEKAAIGGWVTIVVTSAVVAMCFIIRRHYRNVNQRLSRLDSISSTLQGEYDYEQAKKKPAPLMLPTGNQKWLPAAEVRGEGLFLELDEEAVQEWERRHAVVERTKMLEQAYAAEGRGEFPGARSYLLHTLSHLLLTAISNFTTQRFDACDSRAK